MRCSRWAISNILGIKGLENLPKMVKYRLKERLKSQFQSFRVKLFIIPKKVILCDKILFAILIPLMSPSSHTYTNLKHEMPKKELFCIFPRILSLDQWSFQTLGVKSVRFLPTFVHRLSVHQIFLKFYMKLGFKNLGKVIFHVLILT